MTFIMTVVVTFLVVTLFIWDFHARSERQGKSLDDINGQPMIYSLLKKDRVYFITSPFCINVEKPHST